MIRHIINPQRLLLVWQPLADNSNRMRRVVGDLKQIEDGSVVLSYLTNSDDFQKAVDNGFQCFPAFRKTNIEYHDGVLETFMLRLPPRSRNDFNFYLDSLRIPRDADISDFTLLGYSEARLPGDGFSIVNPFDELYTPCEFLSEIAGFRHYQERYETINFGSELTFEFEENNMYDPNAIKIIADGIKIGYVNRIQTKAFKHWVTNKSIRATIERKNGIPGKVKLYMFVEVS